MRKTFAPHPHPHRYIGKHPYRNGKKENTAAATQNNIFDFFFMTRPFILSRTHGARMTCTLHCGGSKKKGSGKQSSRERSVAAARSIRRCGPAHNSKPTFRHAQRTARPDKKINSRKRACNRQNAHPLKSDRHTGIENAIPAKTTWTKERDMRRFSAVFSCLQPHPKEKKEQNPR